MRAHLLYRDRDFDLAAAPPPQAENLAVDLGLEDLWRAMAGSDRYLYEVSRRVTVASLSLPGEIRYRQEVLQDCLERPEAVAELYRLTVEAVDGERRIWGLVSRHPSGALHRALEVLELLVPIVRRLRAAAAASAFRSEGLSTFSKVLQSELDDPYLAGVEGHLKALRLREGLLLSARLGPGNRGVGYVLRHQVAGRMSWGERLGMAEKSQHSFRIAPRDEAGFRALSELSDRGLNTVADAVAQAAEHVLSFMTVLRWELGFYLACLNLHQTLMGKGAAVCWPTPTESGAFHLRCRGLYDIGLALRSEADVVGNDLEADGRQLVVVTGANSGGKSTFLRSVGLAQLLLQAGVFVGAGEFSASPSSGVFTHFVRSEGENRGRLAEELARMSGIVDLVGRGGLLLLNESFSGTNEREGSEISRQIIRALLEGGVRVVLVTHFFDLADGFRQSPPAAALFLRAERLADGRRTYRLRAGDPLPTAFGADLIGRLAAPPGGRGSRPDKEGGEGPD
ncbi:MAG: DNA mismatch repair protein MutS, partial [Candidatus Dormiibacterota bacterium]